MKRDWTRSRESWAEIKIGLPSQRSPRVVKLKGLWKGLLVSKQDVAKAKSSLFKNASD